MTRDMHPHPSAWRRQGAEKLLGVLITVGQALAYVVAGMYGDISDLGAGNAILIVLQVRIRVRSGTLVAALLACRREYFCGAGLHGARVRHADINARDSNSIASFLCAVGNAPACRICVVMHQ